jgi:hypothetical protein
MSENLKKLAREAGGKKKAEWLPEFGGDGKRGFQDQNNDDFECCGNAQFRGHMVWCEKYPMEAP